MFCFPWCARKKASNDSPEVEGYNVPTLPDGGGSGGEMGTRSVKSVDVTSVEGETSKGNAVETLEEGSNADGVATPKITITNASNLSHENLPLARRLPIVTQNSSTTANASSSTAVEAQNNTADTDARTIKATHTASANPKVLTPKTAYSPVLPPLDLSGSDELNSLRSSVNLSSEDLTALVASLSNSSNKHVNPLRTPLEDSPPKPILKLPDAGALSIGNETDSEREDIKPLLETQPSLSDIRGSATLGIEARDSVTQSVEIIHSYGGTKTPSVVDITADSDDEEGTPCGKPSSSLSPPVGALQLGGVEAMIKTERL